MKIIITPERMQNHRVQKYQFREFNIKENSTPQTPTDTVKKDEPKRVEKAPEAENIALEEIKKRQDKESGMVESLIGKVEEFGGSVIRLQEQIERQEAEFQTRLEEEKKRAYADGVKDGENSVKTELLNEIALQKEEFIHSVEKIIKSADDFGKQSSMLEKELSSIAIEIASEVIQKEVEENGTKIAKSLASALLNELQDASRVTIKVNPDHLAELTSHFADQDKIEIVADRAIKLGGVIITSDAGNINAEVHNRFLAVKKSILEGPHI